MKNRRRARGRIEALEKLCRAVLFASPIMPEVRSSAACVPPGTEESALIDAADQACSDRRSNGSVRPYSIELG